jgi:hypothetical protein
MHYARRLMPRPKMLIVAHYARNGLLPQTPFDPLREQLDSDLHGGVADGAVVWSMPLAIGSISQRKGIFSEHELRLLKEYLGVAALPAVAMPPRGFHGVERGFVLSPRASVEQGERLTVTYIALLTEASVAAGKVKATLHHRPMGGTVKYTEVAMAAVRSVYTASLAVAADVEYFVSVSGGEHALVWPAGAPAAPHTVIAV